MIIRVITAVNVRTEHYLGAYLHATLECTHTWCNVASGSGVVYSLLVLPCKGGSAVSPLGYLYQVTASSHECPMNVPYLVLGCLVHHLSVSLPLSVSLSCQLAIIHPSLVAINVVPYSSLLKIVMACFVLACMVYMRASSCPRQQQQHTLPAVSGQAMHSFGGFHGYHGDFGGESLGYDSDWQRKAGCRKLLVLRERLYISSCCATHHE